MSIENERTLKVYNKKASVYLNTSLEHDKLDPSKAKIKREKLEMLIVYHMGAERYYNCFRQKDLDDIIKQAKFKIENFQKEGGDNNDKWLVYVLKK